MSTNRYAINSTNLAKMNFRLLYVSQASYGKDWHSIKHTHHFTELFYVIQGHGKFLVENETFTVKEDDLIVVNPNVSHTEQSDNHSAMEYIVLGIDGLQFLAEENNEVYDYSIHNYQDYKHEILFYLRTLVEEVKAEGENFELMCQNLLEILIINMIRRTRKKLLLESSKKVTKECRFIETYINEHFKEDITLEMLSKLTYLNKYYIVHSFKKYKGISPINYLIERRIQEAKNLLETTNYSVSKVGEVSGFSSQSYFSQIFKKEVHMSPIQYRKLMEKTS